MDRRTFVGNLPRALFVVKSDQIGGKTSGLQCNGDSVSISELCNYGGFSGNVNNGSRQKWSFEIYANGKEILEKFCFWTGNRSLEIYMLHGLVLNIFRSNAKILFNSIEGYLLTSGNFVLTMGLCVIIIDLLSQNIILKKVLSIR